MNLSFDKQCSQITLEGASNKGKSSVDQVNGQGAHKGFACAVQTIFLT